jgi:acyl-homoserine-lactone acylase
LGPVVYEDAERIYVMRSPVEGEFRAAEQFLKLIQATSLEEWTDAMKMRAHPESNFVYADAGGNIFYIWNAAMPIRPHPAGASRAVAVERSEQIWTRLHDLESLPQLLNPPRGYVRNENDGPWLTNLASPLNRADYPAYFDPEEERELELRSQHSLLLVDNDRRLSLEDVVGLKHSYRMLLADRVKGDLTGAVRRALAGGAFAVPGRYQDTPVAAALLQLERWDNTAAADSRGGVLFEHWWRLYEAAAGEGERFRRNWTPGSPIDTPVGLADLELASQLFPRAVEDTIERFGTWDLAWGEVHRVRRGPVDAPVGGCAASLGCFRVLNFETDSDSRRRVSGGDGWVLAVEFTDPPRAFSVLGYGQSAKQDSPHYADQADLFARGEMKPVAYTREAVENQAVRRYRPGLE